MAWVHSSASVLAPLPLQHSLVGVYTLPHTPAVLVVSETALFVLDSQSLTPLALHTRSAECLQGHRENTACCVAQLAVNTLVQARVAAVNVYVVTAAHYLLLYVVHLDLRRSSYEIHHAAQTGLLLQNSLPLAAATPGRLLSAFWRLARTLLLGLGLAAHMASVEHFAHAQDDDEQRNAPVPPVSVAVARILRLPAPVARFWCKPSSHTLVFHDGAGELRVLNTRTTRSETVALAAEPWYTDTAVLEYNPAGNYFLHVDSRRRVSVLRLEVGDSLAVVHTPAGVLPFLPLAIHINPQTDLFVAQGSDGGKDRLAVFVVRPGEAEELGLWDLNGETVTVEGPEGLKGPQGPDKELGTRQEGPDKPLQGPHQSLSDDSATDLATLSLGPTPGASLGPPTGDLSNGPSDNQDGVPSSPPSGPTSGDTSGSGNIAWSPCGSFFLHCSPHLWRLYSKFGTLSFASTSATAEIDMATAVSPTLAAAFRFGGNLCVVANNGQAVFFVDTTSKTLQRVELLRLAQARPTDSLFYDSAYISILRPHNGMPFAKVAMPPLFQKLVANMQHTNGAGPQLPPKVPLGRFSVSLSRAGQLAVACGAELAVSTPTALGPDARQTYWFQFYNHLLAPMNVVLTAWLNDYLLVVNRVPNEVGDAATSDEPFVDELLVLNTNRARYAAGGTPFVFDSDTIAWRHSVNSTVLLHNVAENGDSKVLVLLTGDFRLVVMDIDVVGTGSGPHPGTQLVALDHARLLVKIRCTIHTGNITRRLPMVHVQRLVFLDQQHVLFLFTTGEVHLLRSHAASPDPETANPVYEMALLAHGVNHMELEELAFGDGSKCVFLVTYHGAKATFFDVAGLRATSDEPPLEVPIQGFFPLAVSRTHNSLGISGLEYLVACKGENVIIKQVPIRLMVLSHFVRRDLQRHRLDTAQIMRKYSNFKNFDYCLELLLFEQIEDLTNTELMPAVCLLVKASANKETIYVNFLRKIEVHYWPRFFRCLELTPLQLMDQLISSENVELCYNYLSIYLNFKKESDRGDTPSDAGHTDFLGKSEQKIVLKIFQMLQTAHKWDECFELCRFIEFLEPLKNLLVQVRALVQ